MKIIAFDWTKPAVEAGRKHRTRRSWPDKYAKRFKAGDICQSYDKSPHYGGQRFGHIRITAIKKEDISIMPDEDFEKEGFKFMEEQGIKIWGKEPRQAFEDWRAEGGMYWIVDFVRVELIPDQ